jgi:hypothetical protein
VLPPGKAFFQTPKVGFIHLDPTREASDRVRTIRRTRPETRGEGKPETFDFLGFTHISGKDRNGNFAVKRHTIGKRLRGKLAKIKQQLRQRMHERVAETGKWLKSVVQGYFNYHAVPRPCDDPVALKESRRALIQIVR